MRHWIEAARPRTLPLALSSIWLGSFIGYFYGYFSWAIVLLASLTTIFLQILSNLANDYGDSIHGADSQEREGPQRAVQAGKITASAMKLAIGLFILLSLASGIGLLYVAFGLNWQVFLFFLFLGVLAIIAAITYTAGSRPYGYAGLGDISVFIFFGLLGVAGTYYLHAQELNYWVLLPASSIGLCSVGVLNLNNIRDIASDTKAGKLSIPVRIGRARATVYHGLLLLIGLVLSLVFVAFNWVSAWQLLFLLSVPLFIINQRAVNTQHEAQKLDPYLKQLAASTLLFVLLFGVGHVLAVS